MWHRRPREALPEIGPYWPPLEGLDDYRYGLPLAREHVDILETLPEDIREEALVEMEAAMFAALVRCDLNALP